MKVLIVEDDREVARHMMLLMEAKCPGIEIIHNTNHEMLYFDFPELRQPPPFTACPIALNPIFPYHTLLAPEYASWGCSGGDGRPTHHRKNRKMRRDSRKRNRRG